MIVYLAGAIQAFVMYCVNGTSRSSLLIESTDSMICAEIFLFEVLCNHFYNDLLKCGLFVRPMSSCIYTVQECLRDQ